jgi:hypothetical protein
MNTQTWFEINPELYILADSTTGQILTKIYFREFWTHINQQYLTFEQAKAGAEKAYNKHLWNA